MTFPFEKLLHRILPSKTFCFVRNFSKGNFACFYMKIWFLLWLLSVYFCYQCSFWENFMKELFKQKLWIRLHESIWFHLWLTFYQGTFQMATLFACTGIYNFCFYLYQFVYYANYFVWQDYINVGCRFCEATVQKETLQSFFNFEMRPLEMRLTWIHH